MHGTEDFHESGKQCFWERFFFFFFCFFPKGFLPFPFVTLAQILFRGQHPCQRIFPPFSLFPLIYQARSNLSKPRVAREYAGFLVTSVKPNAPNTAYKMPTFKTKMDQMSWLGHMMVHHVLISAICGPRFGFIKPTTVQERTCDVIQPTLSGRLAM